ncbi:MAG: DNA-3-methyladenine glycosylase [Deferrisomatales bacterium]
MRAASTPSAAATRLDREFFAAPTLQVARRLLGQRLVRLEAQGVRVGGRIIETEAYVGGDDLGCHGRSGRTARNASMWGPPGHAYVYFTYGMHWLLNLVTEVDGFPAAVLIRGLRPEEGVERMRARRRGAPPGRLADGPAKLCQALGLDRAFDGHDVCGRDARLWVERAPPVPDSRVRASPRVGLNSVPEPWKSIPWNFRVRPEDLPPLQ